MTHRSSSPSLVRLAYAFALAILLSIPVTLAAPSPATGAGEQLAGRALGETPLMDDLRELCDRIGGRPSGSEACDRAVEWGAAKFREAGIEKVSLEEFTVPALWLPGTIEISCTAPEKFALRAVSAAYSPSTPPGAPIEAKLVDAGMGAPEDFEKLGASASGAVALVSTGTMDSLEALFGEYLRDKAMLEAAQKAGVKAILLMSMQPNGLLYRHLVTLGDAQAPMPVALVSREHAMRLARLAQAGSVRVKIDIRNKTGGPYTQRNVIAEIPGREKPNEIVLLGAHLDSWALGTGAEDNGVNVALVIDVARGMKELGLTPRRTVRFALFTGEEQGMWGSAGYVKTHASELDDHVAVVIHDLGWGRVNGYFLSGRDELVGPADSALKAVAGLGPFHHVVSEAIDGTDNFDFILSGVPNFVADQDATPYLPSYHSEADTYDGVDARMAHEETAIAAALVWSLADSPERPGKRQTRAEVDKLIEDTHLDEIMKAFGQWESWESGERGVSKK